MAQYPGISAALAHSDRVDQLVSELSPKLAEVHASGALIALGAYGRRELTPRTGIDLLFLYDATSAGEPSTSAVTEAVCYPLWAAEVTVDLAVRTLAECTADARRSWSVVTSYLDARLVAGDVGLFDEFTRQLAQPWRRDLGRLRHRLRTDAERRHANHPSAAASVSPDVVAGRGGLLDLQALAWLAGLEPDLDERHLDALDFLLRTLSTVEDLVGHVPHRISQRLQERVATVLGLEAGFLAGLYAHSRWVAFSLDGALAHHPDDRQLGPSLAVKHGQLVAERPPPLGRAPSLGLRAANLVGLAPADVRLLAWASESGPAIDWDDSTLDQFWLLLRAADWRAWDFLDVTGLLIRYLPELAGIWRRGDPSGAGELALDCHSFLALRRLHEWTEGGDPLADRAWRPLRRRDWLYLAVLLHELEPERAVGLAQRLGLPEEACDGVGFVVGNYRLLADTATRRDLHDEDLLLDIATRIRTRQRLSMLFLVTAAHDLASGPQAWTPWKADLMRQLFARLDAALRQPGEVGRRRTRSLDQHRERIARELVRRGLEPLLALVPRLPRRYVLTRTPAFVAQHLALVGETPALADGEVRLQAHRHRQTGLWDVMIVARDRPGLLATVAGVLALRGTSVLAADAATCADGLVLDVFTVGSANGAALEPERWPAIAADVQAAFDGRVPLRDLLGARPMEPGEAELIQVSVDNTASQFFNVVEVRAPDQVGLLYRITSALYEVGLDIHHARIATHPEGALDVFYVRDLGGEKLSAPAAAVAAEDLTDRLRLTPTSNARVGRRPD